MWTLHYVSTALWTWITTVLMGGWLDVWLQKTPKATGNPFPPPLQCLLHESGCGDGYRKLVVANQILLFCEVLTRRSAVYCRCLYLWGIFQHLHLCLRVIMFAFRASYAWMLSCVAPTSSKSSFCLLSVCIKEKQSLSQLSPLTRIRYCHLLSAVISLPSSQSLRARHLL